MKILVTGGCGFIGSHFIRYALSQNDEIINLDNQSYAGRGKNLEHMGLIPGRDYLFIKGDICDPVTPHALIDKADAVVNFAAESHVDKSYEGQELFKKTNISGLENLLSKTMHLWKCKKNKIFLQVSSDEVYGSIPEGEATEEFPLNALKGENPYAKTKAEADEIALKYFKDYEIPVIITRSSNNIGQYQFPEKLIPLFITNLMLKQKVPLMGDGENIREWTYVEDNCRAIYHVLKNGVPGQAYNIGSGERNRKTNMQVTKAILELFGVEEKSMPEYIQVIDHRKAHDFRYALNSEKLRKLGFDTDSFKSFDEVLLETVRWYQENKQWWDKLK